MKEIKVKKTYRGHIETIDATCYSGGVASQCCTGSIFDGGVVHKFKVPLPCNEECFNLGDTICLTVEIEQQTPNRYFLVDFCYSNSSGSRSKETIVCASNDEDAILKLKKSYDAILINDVRESSKESFDAQEKHISDRQRWNKILIKP